jgi:hypothetical protein
MMYTLIKSFGLHDNVIHWSLCKYPDVQWISWIDLASPFKTGNTMTCLFKYDESQIENVCICAYCNMAALCIYFLYQALDKFRKLLDATEMPIQTEQTFFVLCIKPRMHECLTMLYALLITITYLHFDLEYRCARSLSSIENVLKRTRLQIRSQEGLISGRNPICEDI